MDRVRERGGRDGKPKTGEAIKYIFIRLLDCAIPSSAMDRVPALVLSKQQL